MASADVVAESSYKEKQRLLNKFEGISKKKLGENYRRIKDLFEPDTINDELREKAIFTEEQYRHVNQSQNADYKRNNLLKQLLRLSEHDCFTFFEILYSHRKERELESILIEPGKTIPAGISTNHNIQQRIISSRLTLEPQLEVDPTLDCLLEYSVITIDEHDQILDQENRQAQRQKIFDIIVSKNNWVEIFIHILRETEQEGLLNFGAQAETYLDTLYEIEFGNTIPADDIVLSIVAIQPLEESIMSNIEDDVIEECERGGILEIYRGNSIYVYMPFASKTVSLENKSVLQQRMLELLKLTKGYHELNAAMSKHIVTVKVLRKPHDSFLNEYYGLPKSKTIHGDGQCIRCLSVTVRKNIDAIISEIERDIIKETFASTTNVSEFTKTACMDKNASRINRAKRFIMYILQHEDAMRSFIKVFKEKSKVNLKFELCKDCSASKASGETYVAEYHQIEQPSLIGEFKFSVTIDTSGITITPSETMVDGVPKIQPTFATTSKSQQDLLVTRRTTTRCVDKESRVKTRVKIGIDYELAAAKRRRSSARSTEEDEDIKKSLSY